MENNNCNHESSKKTKSEVWKKRTLMERYLILIIIFVFIILILFIGLFIHFQTKQKYESICLTPICKEEVGRIMHIMDFSVNPCDNFYNFACGNFMKYETIDFISNIWKLAEYINYEFKELLEKPADDNEPHFAKAMKRYYNSCMTEVPLQESFEYFLNVTKLGGWPLSTSGEFTLEELMTKTILYTKKGYSFIFQLTPVYKNGSLQHIEMNPGEFYITRLVTGNLTEETIDRLKNFYSVMFKYVFTKIKPKEAFKEKFTEDIFSLAIPLATIIKKDWNNNSTNLTISELENECSQFKWTSFFKRLYEYMEQPDDYNDSIPLKVNKLEYFKELCQLLEEIEDNGSKTTFYNLIIWDLLLANLLPLDDVFVVLQNDIYRELKLNIRPYTSFSKWEKCLAIINIDFYSPLHFWKLKFDQEAKEKVQKVEGYVKELLSVADEAFVNAKWLDDESRNYTRFKVQNMNYDIGFMNVSKYEKFNKAVNKINITDNFIQNILEMNKFYAIDSFFDGTYEQLFKAYLQPYIVNAFFYNDNGKEEIKISLGILNTPVYSHGAPNYLNYAGIGTIIGHEIFHGFDTLDEKPDETEDETENEIKIEWPENFLEEYKTRKECYINQYSAFPLYDNVTVNGNSSIRDNIADNEGLIHGYRSYEKYVKKHGKEPKLPGMNFTNEQVFFIRFAQMSCEKVDYRKGIFDSYSPGKYRVLGPLMNFPEFSKIFNCPLNSYMNPENKCNLFGI